MDYWIQTIIWQNKSVISKSPILIGLNFWKYFLLFSFENPIDYSSIALRDIELKYNNMENQAYTLFESLKDSKVYILHSHVIAFVPNNIVKDILTQVDPKGRRGKLNVVLLKYDLEIKPTNLVKGHRL